MSRGCVTPKVIQNVKRAIEDDFNLLDGYEDLPEDEQQTVRNAIEDGHVADEDFNGVSRSFIEACKC